MTNPNEDLSLISAKTLEHYDQRAAQFWEGTRDHDVRQNIEALLRHMRGMPPLRILDFGCGPGRDLAAFRALVRGRPRTVSSILVLDRDGLLRNGSSPNLPAGYLNAIDRLKPDPGVGTCAAVPRRATS